MVVNSIPVFQVCIALSLTVVLMMSGCCDATFGGGSHKKVIIHVPVKYQMNTHTHTIYRHIHQHHDAEEVEKPKYEEEKKVEETYEYEPIESHHEYEEKKIAEEKYDRPDFHMVAKKLVESKKDHSKPWATHFH
jgi:hypothetical protein